jgi:beta-lactam-binding protein with PASTA domain
MNFIKFLFSKTFLLNMFLVLLVLVGFFYGGTVFLKNSTNHGQKLKVPNLAELTVEETADKLERIDLRYEVQDSASFNPNYPPLTVVEQRPKAGSLVKEKRKIYLTINPKTFQQVNLPNIFGKTKREALSQLRAMSFKPGEFTYIEDAGLDVVRGASYKGKKVVLGDKLPKYAIIDLELGDGTK